MGFWSMCEILIGSIHYKLILHVFVWQIMLGFCDRHINFLNLEFLMWSWNDLTVHVLIAQNKSKYQKTKVCLHVSDICNSSLHVFFLSVYCTQSTENKNILMSPEESFGFFYFTANRLYLCYLYCAGFVFIFFAYEVHATVIRARTLTAVAKWRSDQQILRSIASVCVGC